MGDDKEELNPIAIVVFWMLISYGTVALIFNGAVVSAIVCLIGALTIATLEGRRVRGE